MNQDAVEPLVPSLRRLQQSHSPVPHLRVQPRVLDVSDSVESELGGSLLEQDRGDVETLLLLVLGSFVVGGEVGFAKVVDETSDGEEIDC